jgi:hypothetical protein
MPKESCWKCGTPLKIGKNIGQGKFHRGSYQCNECSNLARKEWRSKNKTRWLRVERERNLRLRLQVIKALGGKCPCGFSDWRALDIDHVNGGGTQELKGVNRQAVYYNRVLAYLKANPSQTKYQLLCCNCNRIKRWTNHENVV